LNPNDISRAALTDDVMGYIEFHIEQGQCWKVWDDRLESWKQLSDRTDWNSRFLASESRGYDAHEI